MTFGNNELYPVWLPDGRRIAYLAYAAKGAIFSRMADGSGTPDYVESVAEYLDWSLDYECYPEMAERKLAELEAEARRRWPILHCAIVHRLGHLEVCEASVAVAVSTAHRQAAFEAGKWLIDTLKEVVPIWKKENWADGTTEWAAVSEGFAEVTGNQVVVLVDECFRAHEIDIDHARQAKAEAERELQALLQEMDDAARRYALEDAIVRAAVHIDVHGRHRP